MQHIFAAIPWLQFWKALAELMLCSNWHVMLRLTVFDIIVVKCHKLVSRRPKMVHQTLFLAPHLVTPKNIATKRGEAHFRDTAVPWCKLSHLSAGPSPRYLTPNKKYIHTSCDQTIYLTKRILAFRFSDNKLFSQFRMYIIWQLCFGVFPSYFTLSLLNTRELTLWICHESLIW